MRIDILTLFPGMFSGPLTESILKRAVDEGHMEINFHDLRRFGLGKYHKVDDSPYGGGAGMVMMCEPLVSAIEAVMAEGKKAQSKKWIVDSDKWIEKKSTVHYPLPTIHLPHRIYLSPRGPRLKQTKVEGLAKKHDWLILLCGHYEGIDQRIIDGGWIDEEISIGDYVLTGGELPAMVLIDAVARQIPGVLGKDESAHEESFSKSLKRKKEYPHYTRPEEFAGMKVPGVLLSGNHAKIEQWRKEQLQ